ncbi:MAG: DUF1214 domain-containing protein [Hyphomicrobium sp.]|nr:DUF1214 domain-containing protein [Hyphomicrobium sp.]
MSFVRHQIKKRLQAALRVVADWSFFTGAVLIGGFGTAWYMIDTGSALTTAKVGPWVMWRTAGLVEADPYTRAHFSRLGVLPIGSDVAETYFARTDDDGRQLHSSCDYVVEGLSPPSSWWSVTVFDADGRLIANPAERTSYTSETAAILPNGRFSIALARSANPGNWLPTGGAGRLSVVLTRMSWAVATGTGDEQSSGPDLPKIVRKACR